MQNISNCQYVAAMNPTAGSFQVGARDIWLRPSDDSMGVFVVPTFEVCCCHSNSSVNLVRVMVSSGGQINPRLQRHFLAFAIGMPSPTSLLAIFETFLDGHLRRDREGERFQGGVVQVCASLIKGAFSVHQEVSASVSLRTA